MARVWLDSAAVIARVGTLMLLATVGCDLARITGGRPHDPNVPRYSLMSIEGGTSNSDVAQQPPKSELAPQRIKQFLLPSVAGVAVRSQAASVPLEVVPFPPLPKVSTPSSSPSEPALLEQTKQRQEKVHLTRSGINEANAHYESLLKSLPQPYNRPEWIRPKPRAAEVEPASRQSETARPAIKHRSSATSPWQTLAVFGGVLMGLIGAGIGIYALSLRAED